MLSQIERNRNAGFNEREVALSSGALNWLRQSIERGEPVFLSCKAEGSACAVELPSSAVALLQQALELLEAGKGAALIPIHAELTTRQAADLLNVSRTFLIKLLDEGSIAYHKVGRHRRIRREDVLRYRSDLRGKRREVLDQLAAESQQYGIGYD